MKLEGSLDAFSLPDIFQLLSFTKKGGSLLLARGVSDGEVGTGSEGSVYFHAGQVTGASADSSRQPLARRLVGSGSVGDDALAAAVAAATSGDGVGVVRALLDQGVLDSDVLKQAATDQAVDAVFDLLRWRNGDFAFVVDEVNPDDVGVSISVESVLAEAESRKATWDAVSQVVPSARAVLAMPVVLPSDPAVSREEWSLLALVDGRRTVGELVDLTGSGQYAVVSTLAGLVQRGLLTVRPQDGDENAGDDHVAVVVRRQGLLAPLEGAPFVPVIEEAAPVVAAAPSADAGAVAESDDAAETAETDETDETDESDDADGAVTDQLPGQGGAPVVDHDDHDDHDDHEDHDDHDDHGKKDETDEKDEADEHASAVPVGAQMLGGAHVPHDVVPARPEPFLPKRQAEFDESGRPTGVRQTHVQSAPSPTAGGNHGSHHGSSGGLGDVVGATATAPDPETASAIQRDPNVNRSLMLRLIAGVRGL